jgi:hypothetical protein
MVPVRHSSCSSKLRAAKAAFALFPLLLTPASQAAVLRGIVSDFLTGKPIARTRVTLEAVGRLEGQLPLPILTDGNGQFVFPTLAPGAYLVSAQKKGFVRARFGQRQWNAPGTPIVLERDTLYSADLKLHRPGAVMGEILDENNIGLPGISVYAWKSGRTLKLVASGDTDDRGFFRIAGLPPGRYFIRTSSKELEDSQGLLPTFLGGVTRAAEATPLDVKLDQEISRISIQPRHGNLTNLKGIVIGGPPGRVIIYTDTGKHEIPVAADGQFSMGQLAPGEYDLLAESGAGPSLLSAQSHVVLSKEKESVSLQLTPAPQLRVRCEAGAAQLPSVQAVSIFVRRRDESADAQAQRVTCGENLPLLPGTWEFAASAPPDMYVAEVRSAVAAGDSYDVRVNLGQAVEVTVVFASQPGTLAGKVTTTDGAPAIGAPVFLNAVDSDLRSRLGGVRMVRAGEHGEYQFNGLAPGRYEVISSFDIQDPGEAHWPLGSGKPVTLDQNGKSQLDISVQVLNEMS